MSFVHNEIAKIQNNPEFGEVSINKPSLPGLYGINRATVCMRSV